MGLFKKKEKIMTMNTYMNKKKFRLKDFNQEKESPKKKLMIYGVLIVILGIIVLISSIFLIVSTFKKNKELEHVEGFVVDINDFYFINDYYKSIIEYEVNGHIYKIKRFGYSTNPDTINDKFEVLYIDGKPEKAYLMANEKDKIFDVIILGLVIVGVGVVSYSIGKHIPEPVVFDPTLDIPNPNDVHLKEVAEEKARLAAEQAAYEAEQARLAAEAEAEAAAAAAEEAMGISSAEKAAKSAQNAGMEVTFLNVDPTKMIPKKQEAPTAKEDPNMSAAQKVANATQGMDIAFLEVDPSQFQLKQKEVKQDANAGLSPAEQAAMSAANMNISFLPVDPNASKLHQHNQQ